MRILKLWIAQVVFAGTKFLTTPVNVAGCCACFNVCQTDPSRCGQPVSTSGPALAAASCVTNGTRDNIDALITAGTSTLQAVFGAKQQQQALAVKAQIQTSQQQTNMIMWIAISIVAVIGFVIFAKVKVAN